MTKKQRSLFIISGVILGLSILVFTTAELVYSQRFFPGVWIGDVYVGNLSKNEAGMQLEDRLHKVDQLRLLWGVNKWVIPTADLQLVYEKEKTINEAFAVGRGEGLIKNWARRAQIFISNYHIPIGYMFSEEKLGQFLDSVKSEVNIPANEPQISLDTNKHVSISPGANGRSVDDTELQERILQGFATLQTQAITLPVIDLRPQLSQEQIAIVQTRAERLVEKKLTVLGPDEGQRWEIGVDELFSWLDPKTDLGWKQEEISNWVTELAKTVDRQPENASFHFQESGRVTEFKPAKDGLLVQQATLTNQILQGLTHLESGLPNSPIQLTLVITPPAIGNGDANSLGITQLLAKGESWFTGSITNRIFNIQKAASLLNGVLVPPGKEFSFNATVGEISLATGFKSAFIIKDGKTILGDGGGVCQVSSTLFRAVLNAGLPIPQRAAHAYRVSYYEQNYQPGFDATIFQPAPDFTFINDTAAHILIQTEFDEKAKKLTFYLYGTSDGRKAEVSKARIWDVTPAPPDLYVDDPTLPIGQVKQTEHKANGAKVAFDWKVTRGDEVLQEKTFYSVYRPWQAVYLRGTKPN